MTDLTQHIPAESTTVNKIYSSYKKRGDTEQSRGYLGASIIGHSCERWLWYVFRYCCKPEFTGRLYRLFETGFLEECRFIKDLRDIGCTVHDVDPETAQQFEVIALGGHFAGHLDGCALGIPESPKTWHVLEFKTHKAKSFTKLKKEGVQKAKPQHYAQCQAYMHLTGMTRALYLAVNKDTDDLYSERIRYDKEFASELLYKALQIVTSIAPPERISIRPDWYECQLCDAKNLCWGDPAGPALPVPSISCRQCCHATATMEGNAHWVCEKYKRGLSPADQAKACDDHLCLPGLLPFASPIDSGPNWIDFHIAHTRQNFRHGRGSGCFGTKELMSLPESAVTNKIVADTKRVFGATVTGFCAEPILNRYPKEDSETVWHGRAGQLKDAWKSLFNENLADLTPVTQCDATDYRAAEYEGGRVAVFYPLSKQAEIIKGKE